MNAKGIPITKVVKYIYSHLHISPNHSMRYHALCVRHALRRPIYDRNLLTYLSWVSEQKQNNGISTASKWRLVHEQNNYFPLLAWKKVHGDGNQIKATQ